MIRLVVAVAIAVAAIGVQSVLDDSHFTDAEAAWTQCHGTQSIHELSNPPTSWPGTRAAHTVTNTGGSPWFSHQVFYTKSGWWDLTWDYYKTVDYLCG